MLQKWLKQKCKIGVFFLSLFSSLVFATVELSDEAILSYNEGKFQEAINLYKKNLELGSEEILTYLNLATIYKDLTLYDSAIELLKGIKIKDEKIGNLLGRIYYLNGQPEEAIRYLKDQLYLGLCYEDLGNFSEAKKNYLKVTEQDENNIIALFRLAKIYVEEKNFEGAVDLYEKIKSLDPSITEVNKILANLYFKMEDFSKSYRAYAKAVIIKPEDLGLRQSLDSVKEKLPKEFFEKEKEREELLRRETSVFVRPVGVISGCPKVRIGISKSDSFDFKCMGNFEIRDKKKNILFRGKKDSIYRIILDKQRKKISLRDGKRRLLKVLDPPFLIKNILGSATICVFDLSFGEGQFWVRRVNRCFRGDIEVSLFRDRLSLINILNLEEYLYGVLPSEISSDSPFEALRAQAIAARTTALKKLGRHREEGFDLCSEVHCQVYEGASVEKEIINKAIDETRGLVITYKDASIDALYSANCGGHTQPNIFRGNLPYLEGTLDTDTEINFPLSPLDLEKYLLDFPDTFCSSKRADFRWKRIYGREDLEKIMNVGRLFKIIPLERSVSGHLKRIEVVGEDIAKIIEGELNIRKTFGNLRSSLFKIETKFNKNKEPEFFILYGGGFGHGVGMCQKGAIGMAKRGRDYLEIITHYFPQAKIKKWY